MWEHDVGAVEAVLHASGAGTAAHRHGGDALGFAARMVCRLWALDQGPGACRAAEWLWAPLQCPHGGTGGDVWQRSPDGANLLRVGAGCPHELGRYPESVGPHRGGA